MSQTPIYSSDATLHSKCTLLTNSLESIIKIAHNMVFDTWKLGMRRHSVAPITSSTSRLSETEPFPKYNNGYYNKDQAKVSEKLCDSPATNKKDCKFGLRYSWVEGLGLPTFRSLFRKKKSEANIEVRNEQVDEGGPSTAISTEALEKVESVFSNPFADPPITHFTMPRVDWDTEQCWEWMSAFMNNECRKKCGPNWLNRATIRIMVGTCLEIDNGYAMFLVDKRYWLQRTGGFLGPAIHTRLMEIKYNDESLVEAGVDLEAERKEFLREAMAEIGLQVEEAEKPFV